MLQSNTAKYSKVDSDSDSGYLIFLRWKRNNMVTELVNLSECKGFEWDAGNSEKNWIAHQVSR